MLRKAIVRLVCFWLMVAFGVQPSFSYEVIEVTEGGTIQGNIGFIGQLPSPLRFEVKKNPDVCGEVRWLTKVEVLDSRLKGAVVHLRGVQKGKPFDSHRHQGESPNDGAFHYTGGETLSLAVHTKSCNFGPFTGVLTSHDLMYLKNQDSIKHVLHSYSVRGRKGTILRSVHNRDIFPESEIAIEFTDKHFKNSKVVAITCDRHDFMENRFVLVDNPYYSISNKEGNFLLDHIPPGNYEIVVWHPVLGEKSQEVIVEPEANLRIDFEYSKK